MIEIIYSKENEKKDEFLRLPKNIRQIGIPDDTRKVYIEDYVITYINQFASKCTEEAKVAILVGYTIYNNSCEYIFVSGAIEEDEVKINKEKIEFTEKAWTSIYDKTKKYFPDQDIVGWFLSSQAFNGDSSEHILKAHIDNFAGSDKLFMKIDPLENEEIFYVFQNGHFLRQMGYYIYYEKNEEMQEYMVQTKELVQEEEPLEQVEDNAAKSFRTIIQERKDEKHQKKIITFMYTTSTFLVMIVIVIGITMMNNYDKMKSMEQTLNSISQVVNKENEKIAADWFANTETKDTSSEENVATTNAVSETTASPEASDSTQVAQEAINQSAIPVENVAGDVEKQETPETSQTSETSQTPETAGTVTQISSSEEEMQNTLESSAQDQTSNTDTASDESQATETATEKVAAEPQYYTVEKGDTLANISMKIYGTKDMVQKICELNNIENDNKIQAGQQLQLP